MKRLVAIFIALILISVSAGCSPKSPVVSIVDVTEPDLAFPAVIEVFYSDSNYDYYFSCPISNYIIVTYEDGSQDDIITALNAKRVTIADLDRFGISYHTREKNSKLFSH